MDRRRNRGVLAEPFEKRKGVMVLPEEDMENRTYAGHKGCTICPDYLVGGHNSTSKDLR